MVSNVVVYSTAICASCAMVKRFLTHKGIAYEEVRIDDYPERQAEAIRLSGATTVPVIAVNKQDGTQEIIVGYNLARLAPALA